MEKTTDLSQVTDKFYDIMFELTTLVMIGTDCIGSCKPNYHAIIATAAPVLFGDVLTKCQRSFSLFLLLIILPVTAIKKYYLIVFLNPVNSKMQRNNP